MKSGVVGTRLRNRLISKLFSVFYTQKVVGEDMSPKSSSEGKVWNLLKARVQTVKSLPGCAQRSITLPSEKVNPIGSVLSFGNSRPL